MYKAKKAFWEMKETRRMYATGDSLPVSDERGDELVAIGYAVKVEVKKRSQEGENAE